MMNDADKENFTKMVNEGKFTQESYDRLLKRFELEKIDLEAEYTLIIKKISKLSRRQRDLVPDFLFVRDLLKEKTKKDTAEKVVEKTE